MAKGQRVERLRELAAQIELLPVSPDRDRLLSECRGRLVDVDTGVTPRAMLPLREPMPAPVPRRPPQRARASSIMRIAPPPPAPALAFEGPASSASRSENLDEPFREVERLSLEDALRLSSLSHVRTRSERAAAPWTLGLRG
jgi:hypothetical protein